MLLRASDHLGCVSIRRPKYWNDRYRERQADSAIANLDFRLNVQKADARFHDQHGIPHKPPHNAGAIPWRALYSRSDIATPFSAVVLMICEGAISVKLTRGSRIGFAWLAVTAFIESWSHAPKKGWRQVATTAGIG